MRNGVTNLKHVGDAAYTGPGGGCDMGDGVNMGYLAIGFWPPRHFLLSWSHTLVSLHRSL